MATAITEHAAASANDAPTPSDDLSRWLREAFVAARAPQPACLLVAEQDDLSSQGLAPSAARTVRTPGTPRTTHAARTTPRATGAPTVRPTYMLMLTLSLATLLLTAL